MMNRSWMVLVCLGLISAGGDRCFAAGTSKPKAIRAPIAPVVRPALDRPSTVPADDVAAAASGVAAAPKKAPAKPKAEPPRPQAANNQETVLGALISAFGGEDPNARRQQEAALEDQNDQNLRNIESQYRPQFEQLLYVELAFLRRVAKPDPQVFVEIAKTAKSGLHVPLREYARMASGQQAVIMVQQGNVVNRGAAPDYPRSAMQKLLMPLVETKLGPEKARLYRQECDKRTEARKRAVITNLVAVLDERLVLTAGQRDKLVEALMPKYESSWDYLCEIYSSNPQFTPSIPDPVIVPLLDENQKKVWNQASKPNFGVGYNVFRNSQFGDTTEIQEIAHLVEEVKDGP